MAEWYMRGEQYDQAKLSRILDVAQDLKVCQPALTTVRTLCVFRRLIFEKLIGTGGGLFVRR